MKSLKYEIEFLNRCLFIVERLDCMTITFKRLEERRLYFWLIFIHTPRQKSIRSLEIFRVQKLILNATS